VSAATIETQQSQALDLVEQASNLRIVNHEDYQSAVGVGRSLREIKERILQYWNGTDSEPGPIPKAYAAWKALTGKRAEMVDPIDQALSKLSLAITTYDNEQLRKQKEAQRKAEEEARLAREQEIAAELAAIKAAGAKKAELKAAEEAARAVPVVAQPVAVEVRPEGLSIQRPWKCRERAGGHLLFIQHIGKLLTSKVAAEQSLGKALASCLTFNESQGNSLARGWKDTVIVPGLEFYQDAQTRYGKK